MTILVATEARFVRGADGRVASTSGVDSYTFWCRYLSVFERVIVLARTASVADVGELQPVEGPGVEVRPLPAYRGPWEYLRCRRELVRAVQAALVDADVLCLRAPGPIAGSVWRLRGGRPFGVEVVGDPLDALAPGAVHGVARAPARTVLARDLRAMCRGADTVAYVTEHTFQRRYPPGGWSTSYSSIDLTDDAFATDEELACRLARLSHPEKGTAADPWRLVSVGSMAQPYKGHDVLIDALAICRARDLAFELTLVGDGAYRTALAARAEVKAVPVHFTGHRPAGAAVRAIVDRADLFVLPSRAEGLPRALIEAMARGVPGLGSRVGGVPELLPYDRLVPPGRVRPLANALMQLCDTITDWATLIDRDRTVAHRHEAVALRERRQKFYTRLRDAGHRARRPSAA